MRIKYIFFGLFFVSCFSFLFLTFVFENPVFNFIGLFPSLAALWVALNTKGGH